MSEVPPPLSIIIPFYDETAFLAMAARSVVSQGIDGVDVIVVNDNPDRFSARDIAALSLPPQVRVVEHDRNRGLSAARNTGMAAARGTWIGFLDADDYYLSGGLHRQFTLAQQAQADMVQANCMMTKQGLPVLEPLVRETLLFSKPVAGAGLPGLEQAQFITSSWSSLYRWQFLQDSGLKFDEEQVKFEDRLFVLQSVTAAKKIAVMGQPARAWRRRVGSISVSKPDGVVLRLQLQLLEKCLAHMRAFGAEKPGLHRFYRREAFNTIARLIWDVDLVPALARGDDPTIADLAPRVQALAEECNLGQQIFEDEIVAKVSRVGQKTRKGQIRRVDVFSFGKALRSGDFAGAAEILVERQVKPAPMPRKPMAPRGPELILHLGMHKTGSTALQSLMRARRDRLERVGVLFPRTGLDDSGFQPVRPGGLPGHIGLLLAERSAQEATWRNLEGEVRKSGASRVVISCENMLLPMDKDRGALIERLFQRFAMFRSVKVVSFVRRPDLWAEAFYRELLCNGNALGARTLPEFLVDHAASLTHLPDLFAPFEALSGQKVTLIDHDASVAQGSHWAEFVAAAGLSDALLDLTGAARAPVYATPRREEVLAARLLTSMVAQPQRQAALRSFFHGLPAEPKTGQDPSLISPQSRLDLIDRFVASSADFAKERGYAPDFAAMRREVAEEDWQAPTGVSDALLTRLHEVVFQAGAVGDPGDDDFSQTKPSSEGEILTLRVKMRPWLRRLLPR